MGGVLVRNLYTGEELATGHKEGDPARGPGDAEFVGSSQICVLNGPGGECESEPTRGMDTWNAPPVEDLFSAGYCSECCEPNITLDRCRELVSKGQCMGPGHYSWQVVFTRTW